MSRVHNPRDDTVFAAAGNRVPYVYVLRDDPDCDGYMKAEDPQYAKEMGMCLDAPYYLHHKVMNPVAILFDPIMGEDNPMHQHLSEDTRESKRTAAVIKKLLDRSDIQTSLKAHEKSEAVRRRNFQNAKNKQHTINRFFKA